MNKKNNLNTQIFQIMNPPNLKIEHFALGALKKVRVLLDNESDDKANHILNQYTVISPSSANIETEWLVLMISLINQIAYTKAKMDWNEKKKHKIITFFGKHAQAAGIITLTLSAHLKNAVTSFLNKEVASKSLELSEKKALSADFRLNFIRYLYLSLSKKNSFTYMKKKIQSIELNECIENKHPNTLNNELSHAHRTHKMINFIYQEHISL